MIRGMLIAVVVLISMLAHGKVVCYTCRDTGAVTVECPVCRGTKYVWKHSHSYSRDEKDDFCGYGSIYTAIHKDCRNGRMRRWCPNCLRKNKLSSTGQATIECPNCNGRGELTRTYYIISGSYVISSSPEYYLNQLDRYGVDKCSFVQKQKMTADELADFKIENPRSKVFTSEEEIKTYLKLGDRSRTSKAGKLYFVIKSVKKLRLYDCNRALSELNSSYYSLDSSNVSKLRLSDEEVREYQDKNPDCKFFRDVDAFREFLMECKARLGEE